MSHFALVAHQLIGPLDPVTGYRLMLGVGVLGLIAVGVLLRRWS